ncbi:carbon starvation protein A [Pontibacillus yanchengensis]|uniref:Carbon starvation protein CstA n=1 Tax=Pontibacillus yanchengensis Y32 TaxID=1385514 RepID=A0A0A2T8P9_9BACI|nr:carbon starvation CstA family protein [Pontibacillus yanchengensis]KGP72197.1 carbon starvation protein CstA [Pontibacillus yanchengensis Y32]
MITFIISIALLIIGYFTYGKFVEKTFEIKEERKTPAYTIGDNVDYLPMGTKRNSMIQLLNIAGVGPIFGPILGALYGPVAFLWIVLGSIFAGAVHDYLTGMISLRNKGAHIPELAGKFLGKPMRHIVNAFSVLLLLLTGTVFVSAPASLINNLTSNWIGLSAIVGIIFVYYIIATVLPIDKIIGRVYPIFGALLLLSAIGIGVGLIATGAPIPEMSLTNMHPDNLPIFPLLFLTISCGALSGFHATQSPIISRTTQREGQGRKIFYGMMIAEGVIAMIWAAAAMSIFSGNELNQIIAEGGPAAVVSEVSKSMLGAIGGTIAIIGVIILPITSGDTSFRGLRMIIADYFKIGQKKTANRLWIAFPVFALSFILTKIDFSLLWRYFSWANQSTAMIALWIGAMYLILSKKNYFIAMIPASFMTFATTTYIFYADIGAGLSIEIAYVIAGVITVSVIAFFYRTAHKRLQHPVSLDDGYDQVA